jgi:metal-responsive CopG/Arc/MetJ family transcriptional regulator
MARIESTSRVIASQLDLLPQKKTTISFPRDLYKQLKIESAKRDREMSAIVADALRKYFSESEHAKQ